MENKDRVTHVSQKAVLYRDDGNFLTIRRSKTAPARPLYWDLPGGDLEYGEDVIAGIVREVKEETGLEISNPKVFDVASGFNDRKEFWVTIAYKVNVDSDNVVLSHEHDDFKWVTPEQFQELLASPRNKKFVKTFSFQVK